MKTKQNKGFTLIELLVVIAIIGILAGIVLVSLGSVRDRAEVSSMKSTMASVTTIANMCINEGGTINGTTTAGGVICTGASGITEIYPTLPSNINGYSGFSYSETGGVGGEPAYLSTVVTGGTQPVITCTITTGSCINS